MSVNRRASAGTTWRALACVAWIASIVLAGGAGARADDETGLEDATASEGSIALPPQKDEGAEPRDELDRWVPAVGIFGGVMAQHITGAIETTDVLGPANPAPRQPLQFRAPVSNGDRMMTPYFALSAELMTPRLIEAVASPRLFARVDVNVGFGPSYKAATVGVPGPLVPASARLTVFDEVSILGQGSTLFAEVDTLLVSGGIGIAFTFDLGDRRLRVRPSAEYVREKVLLSGVMNRVVQIQSPAFTFDETTFRFLEYQRSTDRVYHGVGPGLELELDARRAGPFMTTVFLGGAAYAFSAEREKVFDQTNAYGETALWRFEKNSWAFRGHLGLRFRWLPE